MTGCETASTLWSARARPKVNTVTRVMIPQISLRARIRQRKAQKKQTAFNAFNALWLLCLSLNLSRMSNEFNRWRKKRKDSGRTWEQATAAQSCLHKSLRATLFSDSERWPNRKFQSRITKLRTFSQGRLLAAAQIKTVGH